MVLVWVCSGKSESNRQLTSYVYNHVQVCRVSFKLYCLMRVNSFDYYLRGCQLLKRFMNCSRMNQIFKFNCGTCELLYSKIAHDLLKSVKPQVYNAVNNCPCAAPLMSSLLLVCFIVVLPDQTNSIQCQGRQLRYVQLS